MRIFTSFIRSEEKTRLDIFCHKLDKQESEKLFRILKNLRFTFCYVYPDEILAFLNGEYSQVKGVMKRLEKYYGFKWAGDAAILGISEKELKKAK